MTLPIAPVVMPTDLAGQENGKLSASLLIDVGPRGQLFHLAARAFRALQSDAWDAVGLPLTYTYGGCFRTYTEQYNLFMSRYTTTYLAGRPTKTFQGKTWYLKAGMATAAVPGTSNHGWGLAIDTAFDRDLSDGVGPDDAASITGHSGWPWFLANAHRYGFSWELQSEPWHIRYVAGDTLPQAVVEYETPYQPPVPTPPVTPVTPPSTQENIDMLILDLNKDTDWWTAMQLSGNELMHLMDGNHVAVLERGGVRRVPLNETELAGILRSVKTTNGSPFAPGWKSANASLNNQWVAAAQ